MQGFADHRLVLTTLRLPKIERRTTQKKEIYDFDRADRDRIEQFINTRWVEFCDACDQDTSVNTMWDMFKDTVKGCLQFVPRRYKIIRRSKPWIDRDIIHLKRKCRRLRRQRNRRNTTNQVQLTVLERQIRLTVKQKRQAYLDQTIEFITTDPQKFWRYMRKGNASSI
jgi:hypothetical protein